MSNVKLIYTKNGEQLVGDLLHNASGKSILTNPLMVIQAGPQKLGFVEYLQLTDDEKLPLGPEDILAIFDPKQDVVEYWEQHFGAGIVMPPSGIITG